MRGSQDAEYTEYVQSRMLWLRRVAYLLCQDWQGADDLVQSAITRLYTHWGKAREATSIDAYVRTILVRSFISERRSAWSRRVLLVDRQFEVPGRSADHDARLDVQAALTALPPRQRATLVLRFYCDLSVEETSRELGCTAGTVKSQTAKGLGSLRRALGPIMAEEPNMPDHDMRTLLRDLANSPEPASTVDLTAARRTGKRRLWLRNGSITAAVAIVVAVAVVIPGELAAPAPSANSTTTGTKDHFNPFIPDAAFGYVPPGYALKPAPGGLTSNGFTSTPNELTMSVTQTSGGDSITLDVLHQGDCGNASMDLNVIPAYRASHAGSKDPACRGDGSGVVVTNPPVRAPDVGGRPAYWLNEPDWSILAWQYAPGAWALLEAFTLSVSRDPITADRALLLKMARTVKFGQTQPIMFPFKLSGAIASGWTPNSVFFSATPSGQYLANILEETSPAAAMGGQGTAAAVSGTSPTPNPLATEGAAGPYAEVAGPVNLLTIIASTKPYDFTCAPENPPANSLIVPKTSVQRIGAVSWLFQTNPKSAKVDGKPYDLPTVDQACNQQPDNGVRVNVRLDVPLNHTVPSLTAILDGLSFSADPQTWTTTPLPG